MRDKDTKRLFGIPGFSPSALGPQFFEQTGRRKSMIIEMNRDEAVYFCSCGREFGWYYDGDYREVRDLSFGEWELYLLYFQVRVNCPDCGIVNEDLDWCERYQRYTRRFSQYVASLCQVLSLSAAARHFGLDWKTVKRMDKEYLNERLNPPDFKKLKVLAVDEIAIKKGHKYATIIIDFEQRRVVWAVKGRSEENFAEFFKLIGPRKCAKIEAFAMDMWKPYINATKKYCKNAEIVFDKFHLVAKMGRAIDKVRNQELKNASETDKEIIKGTKYLLLKNKNNLDKDQKSSLKELLVLNKRLSTMYILKDDLKQLWHYTYPKAAENFFNGWYRRAIYSKIEPLKEFARTLKRHWQEIVAHCRYSINTSVLEGMNNKAKVIKRVAYGYHDIDYFFLKLRAAFPGR